MELHDSHVWIALFVLVVMVGYTLYDIYAFMPTERACEPSFKVINTCGAIPDEHLAQFFNISDYCHPWSLNG